MPSPRRASPLVTLVTPSASRASCASRASLAALALPALALLACAPPGDPAAVLPPAARAKLPADELAALTAGEARPLLLVIDPGPGAIADATGGAGGDAPAVDWRTAKSDVVDLADASGLAIDDTWDALPIVPVTAASLDALAPALIDERVLAVSGIQQFTTQDVESFALVNQPTALAAGKQGTGTTVAVLDTGVDYTRAAFGCTAPGTPATCKVAVAKDIAADDGARDASGHGTNVAGIVVGMAPGARVLALDVFAGSTASSTTILAAYNWVLQNRATYKVAAVNLSLGGGRATAPCATDALAVAFATGRSAGIVTTVASGNEAMLDATSWPACAPAAVSVGAVYDAPVGGLAYTNCTDNVTAADRVTCFSNSASFLTLLAPGALIDAAGYRMAGTSQAAPHVAGAAAVLRAAFPADSGDALVNRLVSTGRAVVDPRTGRTTRRLDLAAALGLGRDTTPPAMSAWATTSSGKVSIGWTATDVSSVAAYRVLAVLGATPPAEKCTAGSTVASGTGAGGSYVHGPLAPGATWSYRVCATDGAGNTAAGVPLTVVVHM